MVVAAEIRAFDSSRVVPAKAGTHNRRAFVVETRLDTIAFSRHYRHGVWVPAFDRDDQKNYSAAMACSVVTVFQFRVVAPTPRTFSIAPLDNLVSP